MTLLRDPDIGIFSVIPILVILVEICLFAYSYVSEAYLALKMAIRQSFFSNSFSYIRLEHFPMQFLKQSKYDRYPRRAFWIDLPTVGFHEFDDPVPSIYKDELFAVSALKRPPVILCFRVTNWYILKYPNRLLEWPKPVWRTIYFNYRKQLSSSVFYFVYFGAFMP